MLRDYRKVSVVTAFQKLLGRLIVQRIRQDCFGSGRKRSVCVEEFEKFEKFLLSLSAQL